MSIDLEKIGQQFRMDHSSVRNILTIFVASTTEDCEKLEKILQSGELNEVKKVVHKLKSSFAYILVDKPVELCNLVKNEPEGKDSIKTVAPLVAQIIAIQKELVKEITNIQ